MCSMSEEELLLISAYTVAYIKKNENQGKSKRKWSRDWLLKRKKYSHVNLLGELLNEPNDFRAYLRMDEDTYIHLLSLVTPAIKKQDTCMRKSISPHERLTATLRYVATGRSFMDLSFSTVISKSALSQIIPETCAAIYNALIKDYLKCPNSENEWKTISKEFEDKWNFPHCLGACDGKHIQIIPPAGSGSYYFNYKKCHSIVLMAVVNANYEFLICDIGTNSRVSDGGAIQNTIFYKKLSNGSLNIPSSEQVNKSHRSLNYVFVGDEAFSMRPDFLKPYNQRELTYTRRIFNYRLSRARRLVENVFGILANRFRIFHTAINLKINNIDIVVLACCALHNFLRKTCGNVYITDEDIDREDVDKHQVIEGLRSSSTNLLDIQRGQNRNISDEAKLTRLAFEEYFSQEGKVSWQDNMI